VPALAEPDYRKSSCYRRTLEGTLKDLIQGTYHGFKFDKYAARYLANLQYRFNRRFDLPTMIHRLLRARAVIWGFTLF